MNRSLLAAPAIAAPAIAALLLTGITGIASAAEEDQTALEAQVCAALDVGGLPSVNAIIGVTAYENTGSLSDLTRATDWGTELLETTTEPQVRGAAGCDAGTTEPEPTPDETPEPTPDETPEPPVTDDPAPTAQIPAGPPYADCDAARADGAAPISIGNPGYRPALDRDQDGVACDGAEDGSTAPTGDSGDDSAVLGGTDDSNSGVVTSVPVGSIDTGYVAG